MDYQILGVHVQMTYNSRNNETREAFRVFAAWASNHPDQPFSWRCTELTIDRFPTPQDIQKEVAALGSDVRDKALVKKMFPYISPKALTD